MTKLHTKGHAIRKKKYSKAFHEGVGILTEEIDLALQWNRPCILFAVHDSKTGRIDAQQSLEQETIKRNGRVSHIQVESSNPDVIRMMSETPNFGDVVFFVSGIENADKASDGQVYRALNIRRELLVERLIRVVFWLNESEAANLPRLAPDFWSFRHRAVEFAPKHGSSKQSVPAGLFLWDEQISWIDKDAQKNILINLEETLLGLPKKVDATTTYLETLLKITHYSWLLNDLEKFWGYLKEGTYLSEKYPIPEYQAWILNAKGIGVFEEGNKLEAKRQFEQALKHNPDNSAIMMNAGIAAHGLGKNNDAIRTGRKAIKKDQGNFHLWCTLGYLFLSMEKNENAVEAMTKAQYIDPHNINTYYSLAVCFYKNEQPAECAMEITKAEKISPPQNIIQHACVDILSGKKGEALAQLKHSLDKGITDKHHILRDPNLFFLINPNEVMELN